MCRELVSTFFFWYDEIVSELNNYEGNYCTVVAAVY